jgi:hypothetical protein
MTLRRLLRTLVVVGLVTQAPVGAQGAVAMGQRSRHWRCDATQKWVCELPGGCTKDVAAETTWVLLDFQERTYQRCDRFGCDKYPAQMSERSVFTYVQATGRPDMFLKVGLADGFLDVAAQGTSAYTSLGYCKPQR